MRKVILLIFFSFFLPIIGTICIMAAGLVAFPGAEGFGRFATGGRGGEIYHVTNLNDSGTGSFRDAISSPNRIVIFDVSGIIKVQSGNPLIFSRNLTILGQTAPGEGVQVYGERVSFSGANNIIVRYMRLRMGSSGTSGKDAAGVANGTNMIFDHLSVLWGRDECFSVNWDEKGTLPSNITIQNSIIGQGLQTHSCGGLMQTTGGVTLFRNLYIENKTRNPKVKGLNQYINNVVYNWGNGGCYIMGDTEADSWADIENNYFINGPWIGATDVFTRGTPTFTFYGKGNYYDSNQDGVLDGVPMGSGEYSGSTAINNFDSWDNSTTRPQKHPVIASMMTAGNAVAWMLDSVGPCLPVRDEVDSYLINELKSYGKIGTTGGITTEKTLPHGGTGALFGGFKPKDSDNDGIPDSWEKANGLNPYDPSDSKAIASNGYANIENYANSICKAYPYIKSPTGLSNDSVTISSVKLSWKDNSTDEKGFLLEKSLDGSKFSTIDTLKADCSSFVVGGLEKETKYYFRIRSYNDSLVSPYTSTLAITTFGDPTIPLKSLNVSPLDKGSLGTSENVRLTWDNKTNNYGGSLYYSVFFGSSPDKLVMLKDSLTSNTFVVSAQLKIDSTYYWRIDTRNKVGVTAGDVWSFKAVEGGKLFYTDFKNLPAEFYNAYGSSTQTKDIIGTKANTTVSVGGMTFGTGANAIRVCYIPQVNPTSVTSDYGPYTTSDAGSTNGCVQFYTTASGGYLKLPEVAGPCVITIWAGNPTASATTFNLNAITNGTESKVAGFSMAAAKRAFKFQYTYLGSDKVIFKVDANGKKINLNDILIETFIPVTSADPLKIVSSPDSVISYADGTSLKFVFNQTIRYNGGITINGNQNESFAVGGGTGTLGLDLTFTGLDAGTEYVIGFPDGALTDYDNTKSFTGEFDFTTVPYPSGKISGDIHFGKAAMGSPLNFKPFDVVAPFKTSGNLVQTSSADFPHWISAGKISADSVVISATSDKMMCYFNDRAQKLKLKAYCSGEGDISLKVQETTNPDVAPGWRTIRVFSKDDFPFEEEFYLNSESRFFKIVPTSLSSGSIIIKELVLSDSEGNFPMSAERNFADGAIKIVSSSDGHVILYGTSSEMTANVYDISGRFIMKTKLADGNSDLKLPKGFYGIVIGSGIDKTALKAVVL